MGPKNTQSKAIQKLRAFCKHCTLHGFYYFSEERHWVVYFIWFTVTTASVWLCAFLSQMIWAKFNLDPTFTVVESTHYSTKKIEFPAVTVCDSEFIYGPNTHNITNILEQRNFAEQEIEVFYRSFAQIRDKDFVAPDYVKVIHKVLQDLDYPLDVLIETFAKPCRELLVRCEWRSKVHNCSEMFRRILTYNGVCCRFDMKYFKYESKADPATNFVPGIERTEALEMIVNGQRVSHRGVQTEGHVSMYIYDEESTATIEDSPVVLTPTTLFDVNIHLWMIESSDDVKALPLRTRKCSLQSDHIKTGQFYQECMAILILRRVVNYCKCLPFRYTAKKLQVRDDYVKCSWERLSCVYQTLDKVKSNIQDILSHDRCLQKCDYVQYEHEVQYMKRRRQFRTVNDTFSEVAVHFSSGTCLKYKREVLYSWDQMLANLGGIFGLCLGGSVISLIELTWFIIDFVYIIWNSIRNRRTAPKKKLAFVVSEKMNAAYPTNGKFRFVN